MTNWEISEPTTLALDDVRALRLRIVGGDVSVTATDGPARLEVHSVEGPPLMVDLVDGTLTVTYDDVSWGGILDWLTGKSRGRREVSLALAVPPECDVQLGTVSADAVVSGITRPTSVRSVSGEITLDGIGGEISAKTVSADVEALALAGDLHFDTVSGDLTVAGGQAGSLAAKTVSGDITLSVDLDSGGQVDVTSVSGDVVLRLNHDVGAKVRIKSVSGRLRSELDGLSTENGPGRKRLEGAVGDGAGAVRVKTVSGDVSLLSRR
jgi:hypothetical protein